MKLQYIGTNMSYELKLGKTSCEKCPTNGDINGWEW